LYAGPNAADVVTVNAALHKYKILMNANKSITAVFTDSPKHKITQVACGAEHTIALAEDGTVWTWGLNSFGQLGLGNLENQYTPVQVSSLSNVTVIVAAGWHSIAIKDDGSVWTWGDNYDGQLGDETNIYKSSPVQVTRISGVIAADAGSNVTVALKNDQTVWSWGFNVYGQLGDGTDGYDAGKNYPVQAKDLTDVVAIAAGDGHTLAIKSDGSVWAWGYNGYGALGDGTFTTVNSPIAIGLSDVTLITAGYYHSIAIKNDGTVWTWGSKRSRTARNWRWH
jgi:alpha-tubulin suppressor-like RCC1 family protein